MVEQRSDHIVFALSDGALLLRFPNDSIGPLPGWGEDEMPEAHGDDAYYVLSYPRSRRFFSADDFREFLELVVRHPGEVFTVFRGSDRERFARRFQELARKEWHEIVASVALDDEMLAGQDGEDAEWDEEGYDEYEEYDEADAEDGDEAGEDAEYDD
jgi:hypothetical protein